MKLRYKCECGHENLWPIFKEKISNFVCEDCGTFLGAYRNGGITFAEGKVGNTKQWYDFIVDEIILEHREASSRFQNTETQTFTSISGIEFPILTLSYINPPITFNISTHYFCPQTEP